jgi:hypothetical protein
MTCVANTRTALWRTPTEAFMDFIAQHGMTFEQAAAARQHDGGDHNRRETPLFAESIGRRSIGRS